MTVFLCVLSTCCQCCLSIFAGASCSLGQVPSLVELSAQFVACTIPFEVVEHFYIPIPEPLQLRIAFWSFPENEEDIRLYSCLANGSADEFQKGEHLFKARGVKDALQIGKLTEWPRWLNVFIPVAVPPQAADFCSQANFRTTFHISYISARLMALTWLDFGQISLWPWPWIFKVKYTILYIRKKNDVIVMKQKMTIFNES